MAEFLFSKVERVTFASFLSLTLALALMKKNQNIFLSRFIEWMFRALVLQVVQVLD